MNGMTEIFEAVNGKAELFLDWMRSHPRCLYSAYGRSAVVDCMEIVYDFHPRLLEMICC